MSGIFGNLFGSRKNDLLDFSVLRTDMHAHLLPGIDDGAGNIDESKQLIAGLQELGFSRFITTPHCMPGVFDNTIARIQEKLTELKSGYTDTTQPDVQAAAEYYIDTDFPDRIRNGEKLLTFGEHYVLVEVNMTQPELKLQESLFELRLAGYKPVLAHAERYPYLFKKNALKEYEQLRDADILLQANLRSFTGDYGEVQKRIVKALAEAGLISFLGTDIHRTAQLPMLAQAMMDKHVQQLLAGRQLLNNTL